jgi:protein-tyrosine phosphatase
MAEAIARAELAQRGWGTVDVRSAGTGAMPGAPASGGALRAAASIGLDLSGHRSQRVSPELVEWADLVLAMSGHHVQAVLAMGGSGRTALLGAFASGDTEGEGVPDPFGRPDQVYLQTLARLRELVASSLARLEPILEP